MSSFYDDASLVVIPSGYKTSKIYAEKPTDGSGDLTFTRASDATRVASNGLIEKVRTNIALYSNDFSNAAWVKLDNATVSGTRVADPFGGNTAWQVIFDGTANGRIEQTIGSLINNGTYTTSFYLRVASGTVSAFVSNDAVTITTTWQRFSSIETITGTNGYPRLICNTASTIQVYAAQFEVSDFGATAYIPTTTAAVSVGPVSNVPRLDYLGSSCPRLLLEPQRTNVVTYSEQLDNAAWVKTNAGTGLDPVVTANNAISPDGTQNADTVVFNSGAGTTAGDYSFLYQPVITGAGSHTASFYAKTASGTAQILVRLDSGQYQKITITNQWQRFTLTQTLLAGTNFLDFILRRGIDEPLNSSATIQLWGAQVEAGAYATSYIPTLAASVTRVADAASKTGISSLIGQTEGTLFVEIDFNGTGFGTENDFFIYVGNGSNTNSIYIDYYNDLFRFVVFTGGSLTAYFDTATTNGTHKIALAYKSGSYAAYKNGVQIGVDAAVANPPTCSVFSLKGGASGFGSITNNTKQALLFTTRLTNAQLAELTTL